MTDNKDISQKAALKFVILLGIVSLCADATYEGDRSITGSYLGVLRASATCVSPVINTVGYRYGNLRINDESCDRRIWCLQTKGVQPLGYFIQATAYHGFWAAP